MKKLQLSLLILIVMGWISAPLCAADAGAAEARMRETLRNTLLQLRDAQSKIDTLTAAQTESDREKAALKAKMDEMAKQEATEKKTAEKEREKLKIQAATLQRAVSDHETKNVELAKIAYEILDRYEKFGLGDALTAKEPFLGLTRVKIENLVQDFKDKIDDQRITHEKAQTLTSNDNANH